MDIAFLQLYSTFFNNQDGYSSFRSLLLNDLQIVSVNRDFSMDKIDALRHLNIIAFESSGAILKDGVTLFINAQLITVYILQNSKWHMMPNF